MSKIPDEKNNKRETEFSSDVATLQRVDELIKVLHNSILGVLKTDQDQRKVYIKTLSRLALEGSTKFGNDVLKELSELWNKIAEAKQRIKEIHKERNKTTKYSNQGWSRINEDRKEEIIEAQVNAAQNFEEKLIKELDSHGFLMKDKAREDETPEDW